jgi:hypothetical protein
MRATLLLALALVGCSKGVDITTMPVGPNGGQVNSSNGTQLNIPPGALGSNTNITIQTVNVPAPAGTVVVGPAQDFGPEGATFKAGVTIQLPFETAKIPAGRTASDILIYTAPKGSTQYTTLTTALGSGVVTTQTSHFSIYLPAVLAPESVGDLADNHTPDLATRSTDMAMVQTGGFDFAVACQPQCMPTGSGQCTCTETCGGHTYVMTCNGLSTTSCSCEIDQVTQTTPITGPDCSNSTGLESVFISMCAAN